MIFPTWEEIEELAERLAAELADDYDVILAVTRAGLFTASFLSQALKMHNIAATSVVLYTGVDETLGEPRFLNFPADGTLRGKKVLVADEVWQSGRTATAVCNRVRDAGGQPEVAVLHYKRLLSKHGAPDFYGAQIEDEWIVYPWDPEREGRLKESQET